MTDEQPKIIVDDDWKSQARAEKERLSQQEAPKDAAAAGGPGGEGQPGEQRELGFEDLISVLASQALMYLGAMPDPQTGKAVVAPEYARLNIDLLGVLEAKTEGNLTDKESEAIKGVLQELRMRYVEVMQAVAKAYDEGRLGADGQIAPGSMPPGGPAGGPAVT